MTVLINTYVQLNYIYYNDVAFVRSTRRSEIDGGVGALVYSKDFVNGLNTTNKMSLTMLMTTV